MHRPTMAWLVAHDRPFTSRRYLHDPQSLLPDHRPGPLRVALLDLQTQAATVKPDRSIYVVHVDANIELHNHSSSRLTCDCAILPDRDTRNKALEILPKQKC